MFVVSYGSCLAVHKHGALSGSAKVHQACSILVLRLAIYKDCKLCKKANTAVYVSDTAVMTDCLQLMSPILL